MNSVEETEAYFGLPSGELKAVVILSGNDAYIYGPDIVEDYVLPVFNKAPHLQDLDELPYAVTPQKGYRDDAQRWGLSDGSIIFVIGE